MYYWLQLIIVVQVICNYYIYIKVPSKRVDTPKLITSWQEKTHDNFGIIEAPQYVCYRLLILMLMDIWEDNAWFYSHGTCYRRSCGNTVQWTANFRGALQYFCKGCRSINVLLGIFYWIFMAKNSKVCHNTDIKCEESTCLYLKVYLLEVIITLK